MVSTAQGTVDAQYSGNFVLTPAGLPCRSPGASPSSSWAFCRPSIHQSVFLVRTIQTENRTVTVRSDHGFLVYPGARTRLNGISSTGGAR